MSGRRPAIVALLTLVTLGLGTAAAQPVSLTFWYPVDVGGGLAKVIDGLVADFNREHPEIKVTPIYSGSYDVTLQKLKASHLAATFPDVAVTELSALTVLAALGAAQPLDDFVAAEGGRKFLDRFWPSMLFNTVHNARTYGIPFQRSTPVMYYNKEAFHEVGLDPEKPPVTWDELASYAQKLTKREGDRVVRWGLELPLDPYNWFYYALVYANGGEVLTKDGTRVLWDQPRAIEAMHFWYNLVNKFRATPAFTPWSDGPQEFAAGKAAMIWHSTGSQAFMRKNVKFKWGLGRIPKRTQFAPPSGGGNMLMFSTDPARRRAAWTFMKWMSDPKQAARWSIASGYLATNIASWELPEMQALIKEHPEVLITRDQLKDARIEPAAPKYNVARDILNALIKDVMANKVPLESGVKQATTNANAAMARQ